jgi:hypothetical protein
MIYEAIHYLYPDITDDQFVIQDDGDGTGPYISFWGYPSAPPSMEELEAVYPIVQGQIVEREVTIAVQKRLDEFAQTRKYDGILSACTYSTSLVPKFQAEGQYCVEMRDMHWGKCYEILAGVQAGLRPMPTTEQALAEMPELVWPV